MLMQLLLPSDEWYYTNHSTKYAKFVKYHAARILVYMGLFHKLGGRVDLFDRRREYLFVCSFVLGVCVCICVCVCTEGAGVLPLGLCWEVRGGLAVCIRSISWLQLNFYLLMSLLVARRTA